MNIVELLTAISLLTWTGTGGGLKVRREPGRDYGARGLTRRSQAYGTPPRSVEGSHSNATAAKMACCSGLNRPS